MFHTVYNSFESKPNGRDYIGKHSSPNPYDSYLGSYKDQDFDPDAKIVLAYSKTPEGAIWFEINFQRVFGVAENPGFANRSYQTSTGFDTTGRPHTPEYKKKRSERMLGKKNPMFGKSGPLAPNFGREFSATHRSNMSKSKTGVNHPARKITEVTSPDGNIQVFDYAKEASRVLGCKYENLKRWCQTGYTPRRGKFAGYTFKYQG